LEFPPKGGRDSNEEAGRFAVVGSPHVYGGAMQNVDLQTVKGFKHWHERTGSTLHPDHDREDLFVDLRVVVPERAEIQRQGICPFLPFGGPIAIEIVRNKSLSQRPSVSVVGSVVDLGRNPQVSLPVSALQSGREVVLHRLNLYWTGLAARILGQRGHACDKRVPHEG
jgi:hypothetical protein